MGTNTFHLLIASVGEEGIIVLYKEKRAVKLGEGGISKGFIAAPAMDRAIAAVTYFYEQAQNYNVTEIFATATSAVRSSSNQEELISRVKKATGISIQVISGTLEAQLIYEGVSQSMDLGDSTSLIMDIGGGSVEFILANHHQIFWKGSFEIGGQRLIDLFHQQDPMPIAEMENQKLFLQSKLAPLLEACILYPPSLLVGASGSFDTLASIDILHKNLNIDIENATEYPLKLADFYRIFEQVKHLNRVQRLALPGMLDLRAEMIVVAGVLIDFILTNIPLIAIRVSTYALKEGVLARLADGKAIN